MRPAPRLAVRLVAGAVAISGLVFAVVFLYRHYKPTDQVAAAPPDSKVEQQVLFETWPQVRQPDLVLVLSGQTYGYLQKCGCSHPQKGGLERRYNFIESLKARGWEVMGLDVGDVPRPLHYTPTTQQTLTKYEVAMQAMKLMGYKAVGVGKEELALPLLEGLTKYTLQKGNEYPKVHAANIANPEEFPGNDGKSALTESDVLVSKSGVSVGVVSVAGAEVVSKGVDRSVKYSADTGAVVGTVLQGWKKSAKAPDVNVLLYQGPFNWTEPGTGKKVDAHTAAQAFPDFHIVLCKTPDDSDAPNMPTVVNDGKTMICQVGQKGQSISLVGIFKGPKGIELYYQRVIMTEEFETPEAKEKGHPVLKLLQDYSDTVRDNDYLSEMAKRKKLHVAQALSRHEKNAFVGDSECKNCHLAEWTKWNESKHAHAYDALAKIAKHPVGRNFDGECIICHTVGYEYKTGYVNEKQTAHLKNVQCEACHGPASLHVAEETANLKKKVPSREYLASLSPWKVNGKGALPPLDKLAAMANEKDPTKSEAMLTPAEQPVFLAVIQQCVRCHDMDNDPKFKLEAYWPNVAHTGLKKGN